MRPAPIPVIRVSIAPQASLPIKPERVRAVKQRKKRSAPTRTFGWLIGVLNLESIKPEIRRIKGKKIEVQPKFFRKSSLKAVKRAPCFEKETIIRAAEPKKRTWAIEKTVCFFSFK